MKALKRHPRSRGFNWNSLNFKKTKIRFNFNRISKKQWHYIAVTIFLMLEIIALGISLMQGTVELIIGLLLSAGALLWFTQKEQTLADNIAQAILSIFWGFWIIGYLSIFSILEFGLFLYLFIQKIRTTPKANPITKRLGNDGVVLKKIQPIFPLPIEIPAFYREIYITKSGTSYSFITVYLGKFVIPTDLCTCSGVDLDKVGLQIFNFEHVVLLTKEEEALLKIYLPQGEGLEVRNFLTTQITCACTDNKITRNLIEPKHKHKRKKRKGE